MYRYKENFTSNDIEKHSFAVLSQLLVSVLGADSKWIDQIDDLSGSFKFHDLIIANILICEFPEEWESEFLAFFFSN